MAGSGKYRPASIVEKKLAFTVNEIVKHNLLPWAEIVRLSGRYGELNAFPPNTSLEEAYPLIAGKILNGMPYNRVEEIMPLPSNYTTLSDFSST